MNSKIHEYVTSKTSNSKVIVTGLALLISVFGFSQSKSITGEISQDDIKIENMSVSVEVDSVEDIESTFSIKDIEEILNEVKANESISFKIICNNKIMPNGKKSHVSYSVDGNTNDVKRFIKSVKKIRKAAIKYYESKE